MTLYKFGCRVVHFLMILILAFLTVISLFSTTYIDSYESVYYVGDSPFLNIFIILAFLILFYVLGYKYKFKLSGRVLIILGSVVIAAVFSYVMLTQFYPRFDQLHVMSIAAQMINECFIEFEPGGYAEIYPYQNGILVFYELIAIAFGPQNPIAIQIINILLMIITVICLYSIFKMLYGENKLISLLTIFFIPFWGFATLVYGNVPGFAFGIMSLWLVMKFYFNRTMKNGWMVLLAGILMGVSCALKMNFMILLIAVAIVFLFEALKEKSFKMILAVIMLFAITICVDNSIDKIVEFQTGMKTSRGIPSIPYIAMGLHEQTGRGAGWHDNYPEDIYEQYNHDPDKTEEEAINDIKSSFAGFKRHPKYAIGFVTRKIASMWNEPSYDSLSMQMGRRSLRESVPQWCSSIAEKGKINSLLNKLMDYISSWLFFGTLLYFIFDFKKDYLLYDIFAVYFLGGFICHLFWEASSQYAIFYVMLLIPYTVSGYKKLIEMYMGDQKSKKYFVTATMLITCLFLSLPQVKTLSTLNRDDIRYYEYLNNSDGSNN